MPCPGAGRIVRLPEAAGTGAAPAAAAATWCEPAAAGDARASTDSPAHPPTGRPGSSGGSSPALQRGETDERQTAAPLLLPPSIPSPPFPPSFSSHHPSIYPSSPPPTPPNAEEFQPGGAGVKKGRAEGRRGAELRAIRAAPGRGERPRYYLTEKKKYLKEKKEKRRENGERFSCKKSGGYRPFLPAGECRGRGQGRGPPGAGAPLAGAAGPMGWERPGPGPVPGLGGPRPYGGEPSRGGGRGGPRPWAAFPLFACIGMCVEKQGATAARRQQPGSLAGLCQQPSPE